MATQIFMSLKNDKHLEHQSVKVGNKLFNFSNNQLSSNHDQNFDENKILPTNSYSGNLTNSFLDFKISSIPVNSMIKSMTLFMNIANSHATTDINILPLSHFIKSLDLYINGVCVFTDASSWSQFLNNTLYYDSAKTADSNMLISSSHPSNSATKLFSTLIQNLSNVNFNLRLNNIFSHLGVFLGLLSKNNNEVFVRINFNSFLSNANDSNLTVSNVCLKVDVQKLSNQLTSHLLRQNHLSYRYIQPLVRSYQYSNGITKDQEYELLLTSYNYLTTCIFVNITPTGQSNKLDNYTKMYSIKKLKIVDENGNSLCNNNYYLCKDDLNYLCDKYFFKDSSFFHEESADTLQKNNFYCLSWSSNPESDIHYHTSHGFQAIPQNSKLTFVSDESADLPACQINMVFFTPSI